MFTMWFPEWFLNPALGPVLKEAWFLLALKNCIFKLRVLLVHSASMPRDGVRA